MSGWAVFKILNECFLHYPEGNIVPGDFIFRKEFDFQTFTARLETPVSQAGTKHKIDLIDITDTIYRIGRQFFNPGAGLLIRFTGGAFGHGFAVLQVARRQSRILSSHSGMQPTTIVGF